MSEVNPGMTKLSAGEIDRRRCERSEFVVEHLHAFSQAGGGNTLRLKDSTGRPRRFGRSVRVRSRDFEPLDR